MGEKIKKLIFIFLVLFSLSCEKIIPSRKYLSPDVIFENWQKYAKVREYDKMFEYEYFYFENVIYCYNKLYSPKLWDKATKQEREKFIQLYKTTLKKLLEEKPDEKYEALLRLKKSYQIRITKYIVDAISDTGWIYVAGDYPGEERIKIIKVQNQWYLINPFGYHSYVPTLQTLKSEIQ